MKHLLRFLILLNLTVLPFGVSASSAEPAAQSVDLEKATLALLDGGQSADGVYLAGLSITLAAGVKTYWRMPGDSGLPPVFDFAASDNVDHVEIAWPAPERLNEAEGVILGFKDRVIFPLRVTPRNPAQSVRLIVTIDFGLCDTLCLPAKAMLTRNIQKGGGEGSSRADIEAFLSRVPRQANVRGDLSPSVIAVEPTGTTPMALTISIRSSSPLKDVIIEGPDGWYFGLGAIIPSGSDLYRVAIPVEQKPSTGTLGGLGMRVTAIAAASATETPLTLDMSGAIR